MGFNRWKKCGLGEVIDIKHGFAFKGEFFSDEPTEYILLTPGNFRIGGGFKSEKYKYYSGVVPEEYILKVDDVIVTMTDLSKNGDTLGYSALIPEDSSKKFLHNQRLGLLLFKRDDFDKYFIYWLLRTKPYQTFVVNSASGSTVKHTSPSRIQEYEFKAPDLLTQRRIADILSALDEKIELNRQTNATLETIAQSIFKEWFLDNEDAVNWEVAPLSKIINLNHTRTLKKGSIAPYLDMANMPTQGHRAIEWRDRPFGSGTKFVNGDTLLARITPCLENGKTAFVDFLEDGQIGWGSTEYIVFSPKPPLPPEYGYYLARTEEVRNHAIQNMIGTSGRQRASASCFDSFMISVPPAELTAQFGEVAQSLMAEIKANDEESRTLSSIRDALLPKLMNGEFGLEE